MPESWHQWQEEEARLAAGMDVAEIALMDSLRAVPGVSSGDPVAIGALLRASFRPQFAQPDLADSLDLYVPPDRRARGAQLGYMMTDLFEYDVADQLGQIIAPTLLVYGSAEILTEISAPRIAAAIPSARLVVIPDAGHFSFLEQPEAFRETLETFLAQ
jgi:pimeloyl-ACP methyl ester carboxylesterase